MIGKHFSDNKKKSKKPAIIISVIAVLVIIAVVFVLTFPSISPLKNLPIATHPSITERTQETTQSDSDKQSATDISENTTVQSGQDASAQSDYSEKSTNAQDAAEEGITMQSGDSESVVVPADTEDAVYFSGEYSPYKAVDSVTEEECSFKEVFGSSYGGGRVVFKSDGSFLDTLTTSSSNSGSYAVKDSKIIATYSNDKNMDVSVSSWNGDVPSEIIINYGGYYVYLN